MVVIRRPRDGALLVSESADPSGTLFHRPLGGHVEFGELAADTARREFAEEIEQQTVRDDPGQTLVIWRASTAASPPLYPAGIAELAGPENGS